MRAASVIVLAFALGGCASGSIPDAAPAASPAPETSTPPAAPETPATPEIPPGPGVLSTCGRFRLRVGGIEWQRAGTESKGPVAVLRATMAPMSDSTVMKSVTLRWDSPEVGREDEYDSDTVFPEDPAGFFEFPFPEGSIPRGRVGPLYVECDFVRVLTWTETEFAVPGVGMTEDLAAWPCTLDLEGEPELLRVHWWVRGRFDPEEAEPGALGHMLPSVWPANAIRVIDADGRPLTRRDPDGEERGSFTTFVDPAGASGGLANLAYPLRVVARMPARYHVEIALFHLDAIAIPPKPL